MTDKTVKQAINEARKKIESLFEECKNPIILWYEVPFALCQGVMWSKMNNKQKSMARAFVKEVQKMVNYES